MSAQASSVEGMVVLCVDRDDDLERKTRMKTPRIGREECLEAAVQLALSDPEEADANAIFAALREYDMLKAKGYNVEVAVIAGKETGGFEADRKLRKEARELMRRTRCQR